MSSPFSFSFLDIVSRTAGASPAFHSARLMLESPSVSIDFIISTMKSFEKPRHAIARISSPGLRVPEPSVSICEKIFATSRAGERPAITPSSVRRFSIILRVRGSRFFSNSSYVTSPSPSLSNALKISSKSIILGMPIARSAFVSSLFESVPS